MYIFVYTHITVEVHSNTNRCFTTLACKSIDTGLVGSVGLGSCGHRGACEACGACGAFGSCRPCGGLGLVLAGGSMFRLSYACLFG